MAPYTDVIRLKSCPRSRSCNLPADPSSPSRPSHLGLLSSVFPSVIMSSSARQNPDEYRLLTLTARRDLPRAVSLLRARWATERHRSAELSRPSLALNPDPHSPWPASPPYMGHPSPMTIMFLLYGRQEYVASTSVLDKLGRYPRFGSRWTLALTRSAGRLRMASRMLPLLPRPVSYDVR